MSAEEIAALRERAKELRCLYQIHAIVSQRGEAPARTFLRVLEAIPEGWQRPHTTGARIEYLGRSYVGPAYSSAGHLLREVIKLHGVSVGYIEVSDTEVDCVGDPFLDGERELLINIAHRIGEYLEWKHTELLGESVASSSVHWRWRDTYTNALASSLDQKRFGVRSLYLGGSTENGQASHGSDIDLYVHFEGSEQQREALACWFDGWSRCLAEFAQQQTGYPFPDGVLNVQWLDAPPDIRHQPDLRELGPGKSGNWDAAN